MIRHALALGAAALVLTGSLCASAGGAALHAQDVVAPPQRGQAGSAKDRAPDTQAARERWERLGPKERAELRERFQRLKGMSESEREQLERRAKRLDSMARALYEKLDEPTRKRLDSLPQGKRRTILHEMVGEEARAAAARLLATLPDDLRTRVESATPADRERFLRDFRRKHESRVHQGLDKLGAELGVEASVREAWQELPEDARRAKLMELAQRKILAEVSRQGLPEGIDANRWQRLAKMPPENFLGAFRQLRELHPELAAIGHRGPRGKGGRPGAERHGSPRASGHPGGADRTRARLLRTLRPSPEARLEYAALPKDQRRAALNKRRRTEAAKVVNEEQYFDPSTRKRLDGLDDGEYLNQVRKLLGLPESREGRPSRRNRRPSLERPKRADKPSANDPG